MNAVRIATMGSGRLAKRFRVQPVDPLMRSAYSLTVNVVVAAGLGVVFWIAAARLYDTQTVGRDAALIAVMIELSTICQLNMANALTRFLPSLERGTARALLGAYGISGAAALVVGIAFVMGAPMVSGAFGFLRESVLFAALYVLAQILWTWFAVQDAALTAMRRAPWVPVENGVFGVLKLAALPLLLALGAAHGVFLASALPVLLLLVPVNLFLFRTAIPEHLRRQRPAGSALGRLARRRLVGFLAQDYGATVIAQASTTALPLLIVALLGSSANAYFYIPYTMIVAFNMLFFSVSMSLVVEGALAEHRIRALAANMARRFGLLVVIGAVAMIAAAPLILLPFGADYLREGAPVLRILACGCLFRAVTTLYIAIARLQGKGARILAVESIQMVLLLAGVAALAKPLGLQGVALSWLAASAIVGLSRLPFLMRFFHFRPGRAASTAGVAVGLGRRRNHVGAADGNHPIRQGSDIVPVLLYHSVEDHPSRSDRRYAVSPTEFAGHTDAVVASGRVPLRIGELAAGLRGERPLPERPVAITFDDGFANTYDAVEELLRRNLPLTVYVTTGEVGAPNRLSAPQLLELARLSSVEVGAHTVSHPRLDELEGEELTIEVAGSKAQLEDLTGVGIGSFSYPHGAYDQRAREAVIAAGYSSAVAVKNALSHYHDDPFAIARWTVTEGTPASRIAQVLEGERVQRAWSHERLRTWAYRTARRRRRRLTQTLGVGG
jgi:peptidoglycan/xylan/chitin deacetylase (PgdA/CDA1 family)/O-antigen/teichoic acid export membrane protein